MSGGRSVRFGVRRFALALALFLSGCGREKDVTPFDASSEPDAREKDGAARDAERSEGCAAGGACRPQGRPCRTGTLSCAGGAAACETSGNAPEGKACGTDQVCKDGECVSCVSGVACQPEENPCAVGTLSCATGKSVCMRYADAPDGTECGKGQICEKGSCSPCVAGAACTPSGGACRTGAIVCSAEHPTCQITGDVTDETSCDGGMCCGGACATCAPPDHATVACAETACTFTCQPGFTPCGETCSDTSSDSRACGPACSVCPTGSPCTHGECAPVYTFGNPVAYSPCQDNNLQTFPPDYLLGEFVTIPQDLRVTALGVIANPEEPTSGVHGILALYADVGGLPSTLAVKTNSTVIVPGDNVLPVVPPVSIPMGNYWIMSEYDTMALVCVDNSESNPIAYVTTDYGDLPATLMNVTSKRNIDFNYYVLAIQ